MKTKTVTKRLPDFIEEIHNGELLVAMDNVYNPITEKSILHCLMHGYPLEEKLLCWLSPLDLKLSISVQDKYKYKLKDKKSIVAGSTTAYLLYRMLRPPSTLNQVGLTYSTREYPEKNKLFKYIQLDKVTAEDIPLGYMFYEEKFKMWETKLKPSVTQLIIANKFRTKLYDTLIPMTTLITDSFREVVDAIPGKLSPTLNREL